MFERISQNRLLTTGSRQLSFYGYDGHGSVRQLTDPTGALTDTYTYDAFGNLIGKSGTTPNNYLFAGEQFDPDLGLYYNRARYLNVSVGRFLTMDAGNENSLEPANLHRYLYANGDPVNRVDPTGDFTEAEGLTVVAVINTLFAISALLLLNNLIRPKIKISVDLPFRVNHYTQWAVLRLVLATGLDNPSGGKNFVTTDWYLFAKEAKAKLALRLTPQVLINFFAYKIRDALVGPNPVQPANNEPGGGTEYSTALAIPVSQRAPVVIPLFTH